MELGCESALFPFSIMIPMQPLEKLVLSQCWSRCFQVSTNGALKPLPPPPVDLLRIEVTPDAPDVFPMKPVVKCSREMRKKGSFFPTKTYF